MITGIGPVTSLGTGKQEFFNKLFAAETNIASIPDNYQENYQFQSQYYVPAPEVKLNSKLKRLDRLMGAAAKLTVKGAELALLDAGVSMQEAGKYYDLQDIENCGVIMGIGFSNLEEAFTSYQAHNSSEEEKAGQYSRMIIPKMMPNSVASWLSIIYNLEELNHTINAVCAS